ncbi:hypothetical protein CHLRE_01g012175v5 [Chlamydomonas reinhardtii]|uniref:Uncharacterized protein n=1 Tax=Chlamydomonas reinhardtii TaxID=3055 RepID=A0A2K3E5I8_CHLRE|nr:uncharacterized protein CHLRE_01g012175v5 [Chlamydomonas reinhardtii]PNW88052.1 hypothetical protein CHLRE_01g012175v5 [Chlamydomonas reinhardtii]
MSQAGMLNQDEPILIAASKWPPPGIWDRLETAPSCSEAAAAAGPAATLPPPEGRQPHCYG